MGQIIIQIGLGLGFFFTWVGFASLILSVILPKFSLRKNIENSSVPYWERMAIINDDLIRAGKSRLGRTGQILLAIGLTILISIGLLWLVIQIVENNA